MASSGHTETPPVLAPRLVYLGPPAPDPNLAVVGDCVWTRLDRATRERLSAGEPTAIVFYGLGSIGGAAGPANLQADPVVMSAVRACDPRLTAHWNYTLLAVAAKAWRESALARLARSPARPKRLLDRPSIEAAWSAAPSDLKAAFTGWAVRGLDNRPGASAPPALDPVYQRLGLKPPKPDTGQALLTPEHLDIRQYIIGLELEHLLTTRMTGPARADSRAPGPNEWALDTELSEFMERYYPARARDQNLAGRSLIQCVVTEDGQFRDCAVLREAPDGAGFGAAAVRAFNGHVRVRMTEPGAPKPGQAFQVNIAWSLS